jgi:hypothetical protein
MVPRLAKWMMAFTLSPNGTRCQSEAAGARTLDLRIKSPLLYQLSYSLE